MKRAAITGATGFVGRHLVQRLLDDGWTVNALTRDAQRLKHWAGRIHVFEGDLTLEHSLPGGFLEEVDVLFHCAGELVDETRMQSLHVGGTERLLQLALGRGLHWIQLSSVGAYGACARGLVTETTHQKPHGAYESTKTQADDLVEDLAARGLIRATLLRPSTIFAEDMPNGSLAQWIRTIQRGLFFYIGPPGALVNYVHVDDVVHALLLLAQHGPAASTRYIVSEPLGVEEFVDVVCSAVHCRRPFLRLPLWFALAVAAIGTWLWPRFPLSRSRVRALSSTTQYSANQLRHDIGWVPVVGVRNGVERFVLRKKAR